MVDRFRTHKTAFITGAIVIVFALALLALGLYLGHWY
jgi:hypothetical protein